MAKDRQRSPEDGDEAPSKRDRRPASDSEPESRSGSDNGHRRRHRKSESKGKRKSRDEEEDSYTSSSSESDYYSESYSESELDSSEEEDRRRRKRREMKKKEEEERRRRKEKERRKRRKGKEEKEERKRKKKKEKKKKKGKTGAVTNSWGKYGIIRETDMWNKRPEFTAWLAEVKKVNLESLPKWEEKQMFKEFMEDHNTATFPSKKYYDLDAYHQRKMVKEIKKGAKNVQVTERTVFDDEAQRRQELLQERERQKQAEVEALKRSMQSGMAQSMKEQAQLREEMVYQYKIGNNEAAAAIQRRLDPDVAM